MAAKKKNGRKKPRSAKQKAATRKLVALNKRRGAPKRKAPKRRSAPKRKTSKRKPNKQKKAPKRMAGKKNFVSKTFNNPTLKKVLMAAGAVSVATSIAAIAVPQLVPTLQRPIVKAVLGFAAGDIVGGASQFLLSGGVGSLGIGADSNTNTSNIGFA